jgi:hypothetical protein
MLRVFSVILAAALVLSATAYAQSEVAGAWDLAVNGPEGPVNASVNLKQDGEKVTGEIESQAGKAELTGTLKGKTLTMAFTIQSPQGPMDIKVNGEVDGASMKGTIDLAGMGQMEFTGKKK